MQKVIKSQFWETLAYESHDVSSVIDIMAITKGGKGVFHMCLCTDITNTILYQVLE
jgi:hypothetical protein